MFTGIVREIGEIINIKKTDEYWRITVKTEDILKEKKIGESIAINGVCVTIIKIEDKNFICDLIPETIEITNLKALKENEKVNIEPAMRMHQSIDGHLVQGHVDCTAKVVELSKNNNKTILKINFPQKIAKYLALKGSITINGVSLTISKLEKDKLSVELIPHTLDETNLKYLQKEDLVNIETDLIAKHLDRLLTSKEGEVKFSYLLERNLL